MPEVRYTSKQNVQTGKFEILKITDNPDTNAATSVEVVASFDTSPECNEAQRRLQQEAALPPRRGAVRSEVRKSEPAKSVTRKGKVQVKSAVIAVASVILVLLAADLLVDLLLWAAH
jgi:hypothetical protein